MQIDSRPLTVCRGTMQPDRCMCILLGGPIHTLVIGRKSYRFEMHPYCGPAVVGRDDEILDRQPGPRHVFWTAVTLWAQQGQRVNEAGVCQWDMPPAEKFKHVGGRHYRFDPNGSIEMRPPEHERLIAAMGGPDAA